MWRFQSRDCSGERPCPLALGSRLSVRRGATMLASAGFAASDVLFVRHEFFFAARAGACPDGDGCSVLVEGLVAEAAFACGLCLLAGLRSELCSPGSACVA